MRIVEQVEQHLLEQIGVAADGGKIGRQADRRFLARKGLLARVRRRRAQRRRHRPDRGATSSAPASIRDMSSRLATKRESRPASSSIDGEEIARVRRRSSCRRAVAQARDRAGDRGKRRAQIVRERSAEARRAAFRFPASAAALTDSSTSSDRSIAIAVCSRIAQSACVRPAAAIGSSARLRLDAADARRRRAPRERPKLKAHIGQRARAPAGRLGFSCAQRAAPSRRRPAGRPAARRRDSRSSPLVRHQQHDAVASPSFLHMSAAAQRTSSSLAAPESLRENSKSDWVPARAAQHCSAHCSRIRPASIAVRTATTRKMRSERSSCGSRNRERVERLDEEEIVGEKRQERGDDRRPQCRSARRRAEPGAGRSSTDWEAAASAPVAYAEADRDGDRRQRGARCRSSHRQVVERDRARRSGRRLRPPGQTT